MKKQSTPLQDQFGRNKHKLRLSLTDRCNFRCHYCMPDQPQWLDKHHFLNSEQLYRIAELMVGMGIRHIRLTGGEPLLRHDVIYCVHSLVLLKEQGLERLSMTTNGYYLTRYASDLKLVGLDDINISLDSINAHTFHTMTGRPLQPVLDGIDAARQAGLSIKLNCVLVHGMNDGDIVPLTRWAMQQQLPLRFIEYMPLDQPHNWQQDKVVSETHIIDELAPHFSIQKLPRSSSPATVYTLDGHFELGVISTISNPFCATCDRLRLTATGDLYTCLFSHTATPLRALLKQQDNTLLAQAIRDAVWHKDAGFVTGFNPQSRQITMHNLGG